jgi:hypothetical protein
MLMSHNPKIACERCEYPESELHRLERVHAGKLGELRAHTHPVHAGEYNRLRNAEDDARLDADNARRELNAHRRISHVGKQ